MTVPELKPCPFCGGKPSHNDGGNSRYGRFWWRVGCLNCGVFFDDEERWDANSPGNLDQSYPPKQCFEVWNTRATHDRLIAEAVADERERCAKIADDEFGGRCIADKIRGKWVP